MENPFLVRLAEVAAVGRQDRAGGLVVQPADIQLGQACLGKGDVVARADAPDKDDGIRVHPPGDERQHVLAGPVQPLHVVHYQHHRPLRGEVGQQVQRGERDHERFWLLPVAGAKSRGQCALLRCWKPVGRAQHRPEQLVQAGERQLRFGLDARGYQYLERFLPPVLPRGVQQ